MLNNSFYTIPRGLGLLELHPDGVLLRTGSQDIDWMARYLVSLDFLIIICHPPALRGAFEKLADQITQWARK